MERNKKIIIGIGIMLGIIALGLGAYFAWKNRAIISEIIPGIEEIKILPIEKEKERLQVISSREVTDYWVVKTASSSVIMYVDNKGSVIKIEDGDSIVYEQVIPNMGAVKSSHEGGLALIQSKQQKNDIFEIFDVTSKLPGTPLSITGDIALSPINREAAYFVTTNGRAKLQIQEVDLIGVSDSKKIKEVVTIMPNDFDIQWPQKDSLYLIQKPSAEYISDFWKIDLKTNKLSKLFSGRGLMIEWASFGDRALKFTTTEGREHALSVIDNNGNQVRALRFMTLPNKCVIVTAAQMYCAIPRNQEALTHAVLPDDYLKRSLYTKDGIYQIDIERDSIRGIFEDENPDIDATNLTVLDNKLLFINRYDKKLYSLDLQ